MTILVLIRHATNDYVKEGRLAGWTPGVHLNAQGQREGESLARRLAAVPFEAIYSSPLERAVETAQLVAECHHLPVEIRYDLGEGQAGEWTGKLIQEVQDTDTWKALQKAPVGVALPGGGESIDQVQVRIVRGVEAIRRAHPEGVVGIVSHADPLKALIAHYLCWDLNQFQRIGISPASASVLLLDDESAHLLLLNHAGEFPKLERPRARVAEGQSTKSPEGETRKDKDRMTEANLLYDLNPVSKVTAGAIGEPGHRQFYLQGRQGTLLVTLLVEKEQISSMGTGILELLGKLAEGESAEEGVTAYATLLDEPIEPLFRVGQLGLGYDQENNLVVIVAYEFSDEENPETVNVVRFWGTREQMRVLAQVAAEAVAGGRPICVLCGKPIDPEGHFCPRRNGHGAKATLT